VSTANAQYKYECNEYNIKTTNSEQSERANEVRSALARSKDNMRIVNEVNMSIWTINTIREHVSFSDTMFEYVNNN
jgi:FixJ family two-component response regulator